MSSGRETTHDVCEKDTSSAIRMFEATQLTHCKNDWNNDHGEMTHFIIYSQRMDYRITKH